MSSSSRLNSSDAAVFHDSLSIPMVSVVYDPPVGLGWDDVLLTCSSLAGVIFVLARCFLADDSRSVVSVLRCGVGGGVSDFAFSIKKSFSYYFYNFS